MEIIDIHKLDKVFHFNYIKKNLSTPHSINDFEISNSKMELSKFIQYGISGILNLWMEMRLSSDSDHDSYVFVFNIEPDGKLINYFLNQYCHELQLSTTLSYTD